MGIAGFTVVKPGTGTRGGPGSLFTYRAFAGAGTQIAQIRTGTARMEITQIVLTAEDTEDAETSQRLLFGVFGAIGG